MEATMRECSECDSTEAASQAKGESPTKGCSPVGNNRMEAGGTVADICSSDGVAAQSTKCPNGTKAKKAASAEEMLALIESQEYLCAACGDAMEPSNAEVDHIQPRSAGGSDLIDNLQWLCVDCNRAKRDASMAEFIARCVRVAQRHT
jgi:hypothetical protein